MLEVLSTVPIIGGILNYVLPFLVLLTLVVFVHELGHYLVARWFGVGAVTFSVGFGPQAFGWTDSRGTRWCFSWIPLGGYVRFVGDGDETSLRRDRGAAEISGAFQNASLPKRTAIVAAGPAMNFLFAIVLLAGIAAVGGVPGGQAVVGSILEPRLVADLGLQQGDVIEEVNGRSVQSFSSASLAIEGTEGGTSRIVVQRDGERLLLQGSFLRETRIHRVQSGSAAESAGFREGDVVLRIGPEPVKSFRDLQQSVLSFAGEEMEFLVLRDGTELLLRARPDMRERLDPETGSLRTVPVLGVAREHGVLFLPGRTPVGLLEAVRFGIGQTILVVTLSLEYVGQILAGATGTDELGGPIAIAEFSGEAAKRGAWDFCFMLAMISASIGLINLFPIPILDGGHLVFYAIEGVRGRPLGEKAVRVATQVGLTIVFLLMIFVTYNDLARL